MKKLHYPVWYRLDNRDHFLIWYQMEEASEDLDGVVVLSNGTIPVFASLDALASYAEVENIRLEVNALPLAKSDVNLHDLDTVVKWLRVKRSKPEGPTAINCDEFLGAWNLFADVSRSIGGSFDVDRQRTAKIYEKLFWGNNLPSMTPVGRYYIPLWSNDERRIIREVMSQGLNMFRSRIKCQ